MDPLDFEAEVYTGLWRDWSRASAFGHILTLSRTDANLLIAFTAFFIAFVSSRFWRILSLLCHRYYSTSEPRHALYHQQQVILRNAITPESAWLSLVYLWWAWRKLGFKRRLTVLSLSGLAAFTVVAFTVAGGFSASISSAVGDKVLVNSNNCGLLTIPDNNTLQTFYDKVYSVQLSNSANYAQQCYATNRSGLLNCNLFIKDHLPSVIRYDAPCPFSGGICRSNTSNVRLDSGLININDDLGLNTDNMKAISLRYVLHCAPLVTDGYTSLVNTSIGGLVRYHYGQRLYGHPGDLRWQDFVYQASDVTYQTRRVPEQAGDKPVGNRFKLIGTKSPIVNGQASDQRNEYLFIPKLSRSDGDVSIIFLEGNGVVFLQPIDDDWYQATAIGGRASYGRNNGTFAYFIPQEAASPMGCVEQYQYCNIGQCGPLASFNDAYIGAAPHFNLTSEEANQDQISLDNYQANILYWLGNILASSPTTIIDVISSLGPSSLSSISLFIAGIQYTDYQPGLWKRDAQNWFNIVLSVIQNAFTSVVLHPANPEYQDILTTPKSKFQEELCNRQTIRSMNHNSFSVFGLIFTYVVGGLIVIASALIEPVLRSLQRRYKYRTYEELEWTTNEYLQLHRLAQEEAGYGKWSNCTEAVPITGLDEMLGNLDIEDLEHPIIRKRPGEPEKSDVPEDYNASSSSSSDERVEAEETPIQVTSLEASNSNRDVVFYIDEEECISADEAAIAMALTNDLDEDLEPASYQHHNDDIPEPRLG
ncbi:hypothetical protein NUW58_g5373 [Xylaria curta]|uniref:Uncharacterized protein n=1 Tax=Xylaria curta TaxID=42375 RepID=A0ACC1P4V8_9PEZI|nr:hypothetical protein NUW58_g5373 [Xylaria curta]